MSTPSVLLIPDLLKAGKLYSQIPNSGAVDFDVTRATTAYRTNASGILESVASGVPRLDYPIGGGCPSLLVEPAATNLVLRSEEFDDASWAKTRSSVTQNATTAPNGTTTADKLIASVDNNTHFILQSSIVVVAQIYSASIFAKKGEYDTIRLRMVNLWSPTPTAVYNLTSKTIVSTASSTAKITELSDGWFRLDLSATANAIAGSNAQLEVLVGNNSVLSFAGDGTSGIFIWGAQLEVGSVATSYIPTVAATATRNADVITKTGVSGFIGQSQGTLYVEVDIRNWNSGDRILGISDGTTNNSVALQKGTATNTLRLISRLSNVLQVTIQSSAISGTIFKIAAAYALNDFVLYANGVQIGVNTSASVPACSDVFLGKVESTATTNVLNDRIRAAAIYTTRLSNSELASLTTL
jgi:hypothetical protein